MTVSRQCRSSGGVFLRSAGGVRGCVTEDCPGDPCSHCTDLESMTPEAWQIDRLTNITWADDCFLCPGHTWGDINGFGWYGESYFDAVWEGSRPWIELCQPWGCSPTNFVTGELLQYSGWGESHSNCVSPCVYVADNPYTYAGGYLFLNADSVELSTCSPDPLDPSGVGEHMGHRRTVLEFTANTARLWIYGPMYSTYCTINYPYSWLCFYDEQTIENCVDSITFTNQLTLADQGEPFDIASVYPCRTPWPHPLHLAPFPDDQSIVFGHGGSFKVTRCRIEGI